MPLIRMRRRDLFAGASTLALGALARDAGAQAPVGYPRLLEGPMVGANGANHLLVWGRTSGPFDVALEVSRTRDFRDARTGPVVRAVAENDFCVAARMDGLQPATDYYYRFRIQGGLDRYAPYPYRTKTAPSGRAPIRVAFGSCARSQIDMEQRIFTSVMALEPDMFLWLGDNVYADSIEPSALADLYRRQRLIDRALPLYRSIPNLATWDDHDFGYNDSDRTNPMRADSLRLFKAYWANGAYGARNTDGIFSTHTFGGVDFFILDGRYHRDPSPGPSTPQKTMLGAAQLDWLRQELRRSRAPFKVLVSGSGWSSAERVGGDSWAVYQHERDALFDFIRDERIEGVFGISGDSHMGELNCIPWSERGGYDFYDFCSSPLAQLPDIDFIDQMPEIRIRETYARSVNFGMLDFQWEPEPRMTFTLHNHLGAPVWAPLTLTPADLRNGRATWREKIDADELVRLERYRAGGAYFVPEVE